VKFTLRGAVGAAAIVAIMVLAPSSQAAFPGKNGLIAYSDTNSDIVLVEPDGTGRSTLPVSGGDPSFSANGQRLTFDFSQDDVSEIGLVDADGTNASGVPNSNPSSDPSFSPDSGSLVIDFATGPFSGAVTTEGLDGSDPRQLTGEGNPSDPSYSADGSRIVYSDAEISPLPSTSTVHVMSADGTGDHTLAGSGGFDSDPDFSPDGELIVFTVTDPDSGASDIWLMNSDGSGATPLTTSGAQQGALNDEAAFSPDGKRIVFASGTSLFGNSDLVVMDVDGQNQTVIATDAAGVGNQSSVGWGPVPIPAACGGRDATITGTPGDDQLVGTRGKDVIAALAGDD
jgi:Tol biopolymer transport system component